MSDFMGRLWRHGWVAALSVLAGLAAASAYTQAQPKAYESATSVLVEPVAGQDSDVTGGRTKTEINLDTEAQLVGSTPVAVNAATSMKSKTPSDQLASGVSVAVPPNTSVLVITYSAGTPKDAQTASHAFAQAYLANRQDTATAELTNQMNSVNGKLQELNAALGRVNQQLAGLRADHPNRPGLVSERDTLTSQVNGLNNRINQLSTTTVNPGRVIRDANLPTRPSKPDLLVNLASGATVGLLLGVGLALLRERLDRRVRRGADLVRRTDVRVLATLPIGVKPSLDDVFAPFDAGGRIFHRLRNEVLASLPEPGSRVIVVTGASRGAAATLVAANLAAAFARTGSETVLISAQLPDSLGDTAPVTGLFDVAPVPGLSDVLTHRATLADAAQRTPRAPWLRVITTGGTASASGLLQSQSLCDMLSALRQQAEYVVIEAPSTASSADAQSLARLADAAILAVQSRRTRYAQVADATEQLRRVGTPVLGAVVVPHLGRPEPATDPHADTGGSPDPLPQAGIGERAQQGPNGGSGGQVPDSPTVIFRRVEVDEDDDEGDAYPDVTGRPQQVNALTGAARQPTATGVLAAFTEDGPLDGAR
jgi:capsular exopolysaccharide synthesis family protein